MKKTLISLFCISIFSFTYSQSSFKLWDSTTNVTNGVINVYVVPYTNYKHKLKIENTTATDINYRVERIFLTGQMCAGTDAFFCAAGLCLPPDSAISQFSGNDVILAYQTLPAGLGTYGIEPHFDIDSTCCSEDIMFKVHNINNPADFATVTMRYICSGIGINESELNTFTINAYPNPANSFVFIKYNLANKNTSNKIVMYDILGKEVKKIELIENKGVEKINVEHIAPGIYFYSLIVSDKAILSRKIIIEAK